MNVIDLFAGCGGFSLGFQQAGFDVIGAVEFDPMIAGTYARNFADTKMIVDDIKNVDRQRVFSRGAAEVIIGGPPCQGFSMAGARIRAGFTEDARNYLFRHYFSIVQMVQPKIFLFENVKGLLTMEHGAIFKEIIRLFEDETNFDGKKYSVYHQVVRAKEFGIPQNRERVILVGVLGKEVDFEGLMAQTRAAVQRELPDFFDPTSVWDAISNLCDCPETDTIAAPAPAAAYQTYLQSDADTVGNHVKTKHSPLAVSRMKQIACDENFTALNETIKSVHSGAYGRLSKKGIAPTVTTRFDTPSGGGFIHPVLDRMITPREAARIQSFPDSFWFTGTKGSIGKQIGNAVPPKISYFLARLAKEILNDDNQETR